MTDSSITILLIEDNHGDARLIREMLAEPTVAGQAAHFRLIHAGRLASGLTLLAQGAARAVLLDLSLPDSQGLDTFLRVRAAAPEAPVVVLTGLEDEQTALKAIQAGAQDYLVKGQVDGNVLERTMRYAIERQELTRALRKSEEQYRLIVETAQEGVWQIDADSRTTLVNRKMADMLGYTVDEMAGASLFDFMDEEGRQIAAANVERRRQGIAEQHDFKFRRKDGADLWAMLSTNPLLADDRRYLGTLAMVADITERKQAEEALRESQELFSLFMRHSPIYAYIKAVTPTESRVLRASDCFQQMIGISGPDMMGKNMAELFPAEFAAKITADDWAVVASGEVLKLDEDLNGRHYTTIKFPLVQEDRTLLAGYTIDITARKQAEDALRELNATLEQRVSDRTAELLAANERLTNLERLKSQFLANASHELRTPLTNIKTALYLLEHGKPEKREKYMTTLNNEAALLQSLLEDLLDAAALDFGRAQPVLVSVDLGLLLAKLIETRVALVAERNLRLDLAADPTTPPMLADAKMLRQAIKALLLDIADHEAAGGRIALYTQPFAAAGRAWAALTVGGDAPAPAPEEQTGLFALAKAATGPQADQPPDTNLRLAVCREIIARHGGHMAVHPRADRSSIVTLWLPAA